ncbi:1-deoxy-D-xylulose-5-phosphate reductoisomerase [Elioraea rosea]|uniref:1-deoxy-D-xylulose-5-phosphate reductoisomerase n=1 Tax=Elioraea rosea TaxID=2492390 RepID=UPI001EF5DF8E|nr:1-deoxy-D-xylulose-5-phosphate reductoisomerase [Elioraea rosea]
MMPAAPGGAGSAQRRVTVLGATGSIGRATLDLIAAAPEGSFAVQALVANGNAVALAEAARRVRAARAVVADEAAYAALKEALAGSGIACAAGQEAVIEAATLPADWTMAGIVGAAGLAPTLAAVAQGGLVAVANKECLVCAGAALMASAREAGTMLLPVDSEHNAIFQAMDSAGPDGVERIVLTASGGPFWGWSLAEMGQASPAQAVAHPVWRMGAKISVDSATMMNKGLEIIEAAHLFDLEEHRIGVLVHRQALVHGLVYYGDGSVVAQMAPPDMHTPIAHTLAWPRRMRVPGARLDLAAAGQLSFEVPDEARFPALRLARAALRAGGTAPAVLNAANEVAVRLFLDGKIGFLSIAAMIEAVLDRVEATEAEDLGAVLAADEAARAVAEEQAKTFA